MAIIVRNLYTGQCHDARLSFGESPGRSAYPVLQLLASGEVITPDGWSVDWCDEVERLGFPAGWRLPPEDVDPPTR